MAIAKSGREKVTCTCCNRNLFKESNYYKTQGDEYLFPSGYFPICKNCCHQMVNDEENGHKELIRMLMLLNRPFLQPLFEEVGFNRGKYLDAIVSRVKRVKGGFLDSQSLFNGDVSLLSEDNIEKLTPAELRECQLFWGVGDYTEDDYIFLMATYEKYLNTYDVDSPTFESIIAQICQLDLDIKKKRIFGTDTTKETKLQLELMRNAGIAPSQEKESKTNEQQSFGMWVKKWETEQPVPEALPMFQDVDGLAKYVWDNFTSPMMTSLDLDNPHEDEYQEHKDSYGISKDELLGLDGE